MDSDGVSGLFEASLALYGDGVWPVRGDLVAAHQDWLGHVAAPGTWFSGEQRVAFIAALWAAIDDPKPLPPWEAPAPPTGSALPAAAHGIAYRLGRHASTTSLSWYERSVAELAMGAPAFVELVALAATGCAVASFGPALGWDRPMLPEAQPGPPSRDCPPLVDATMNWVPVTAPADEDPAVVQAFTAVPAEYDMLWRLAAAQYIPLAEMVHLGWKRPESSLQRRQVELVAARLSMVRECFY